MLREDLHNGQMKLLLASNTLMLILIVCMSFPSGVYSQITVIPITPKPVGSGARALGQSAFIAVADDATAASWNPAGLINLEKAEASFVGAWRSVEEDSLATNPLALDTSESWSESEINFMSYAQPLQVGSTDVVLSINYHQVYDFGVEFNSYQTGFLHTLPFGNERPFVGQDKGKSKGALSVYTLASGVSIPSCPEITIGMGINWYTQSLLNDYAWRIKRTITGTTYEEPFLPEVTQKTYTETFDDFRAHNLTLGLLWDAYEKQENLLTFGLVYHTPFTARVDWEVYRESDTESGLIVDESMDIDFPLSLGAGVNYRFSDSLSAAFDVEWKEWSELAQKYANGTQTSPVDDDTLAYRLGFEHLKFPESAEKVVSALRYGAFYEPRPVAVFPDPVPVYGFSAGLGWTLREKFSLDFAYQYRWGEEDLEGIEYKIKEQFYVVSLITYF